MNIKSYIFCCIMGIVLGSLLSISIRYPVDKEVIQKAQDICPTKDYKKMKVGLSGKIYEITCSDGTTLIIK